MNDPQIIRSVYIKAQAIPNCVVMTPETESHFYAWLERMIPRRDQWDVEQDILALLSDHPELIETHSWPEMERMARYRV